jgi:F-type H+-transporting ATPase subunit delta
MLDEVFSKDPEIEQFLNNPLIKAPQRLAALEKGLAGQSLSKETYEFVMLLVRKDRFPIFKDVVHAYQAQADSANNVCRGVVRSTVGLTPEERQRVEATVEKVLNKKVIMTYKVDPSVIGGLVAQVGSYTFDDSLSSHLRRMNEELKRRTV